MRLYLPEMTSKEMEDAVGRVRIAILPVGSIEWHEAHLPLDVDMQTALSVALKAAERMYPDVLVAAPMPYGVVRFHHPGSCTIPPHAYMDVLVGICESLKVHCGVQKLVILNGHGSNRACVLSAAQRATKALDMQVIPASYWDLIPLSAEKEILEIGPLPGHASEFETSLLYYLMPERVRKERVGEGGNPERWRGVACATAEKGERLFNLAVDGLVSALRDIIEDRTDTIPPRFDIEGWTVEHLGTKLWLSWSDECQEYIAPFRDAPSEGSRRSS